MGKKPLQFQVAERFRAEMEKLAQDKEITLSELLRQSVRIYMILDQYIAQGYKVVLRKDNETEKEIIVP